MNGSRWVAGLTLAVAIVQFAAPGTGSAAISQSAAVQMIEQTFDVEVLRARAGQIDGRAVWLLTVMNRGGDFNAAFQVNTLAVDQETGKLVPAFRHRESGYDLPGAGSRDDKVGLRPDAVRSRTWR
jgi:hypothetical protein